MYFKQLQENTKPWMPVALLLIGLLTVNGVAIALFVDSRKVSSLGSVTDAQIEGATATTINALGRLEPEGEITRLSASTINQRLAEVLVSEGDVVKVGQIIAISDGLKIRQAALNEAEAKLQSARARLATVQAGKSTGDISAQKNKVTVVEAQWLGDVATQKSKIASLETELSSAKADYRRYEQLYRAGAISASTFQLEAVEVESLQEQLRGEAIALERITLAGQAQTQSERNILESVSEVRSVEIAEAKAIVAEAEALRRKAIAELELSYVRSPIEGQIISLYAKAGEIVSNRGIAGIGKTQQMYAVAEIYETDIRHIRVGQEVTLMSEYGGFAGELEGQVEQIGLQISRPGTANDDPNAAADVRVVEIKIKLNPEASERVKHLSKLQVRASIQI